MATADAWMDEHDTFSPGEGGFVIRFRAPEDVEQGRFGGRAEYVATGQIGHFQTPDELTAFVKRVLQDT